MAIGKMIGVSPLASSGGWPGNVRADIAPKIDQVGTTSRRDEISLDNAQNRHFLGRRAAGVTLFDPTTETAVDPVARSKYAQTAGLSSEFGRRYSINEDSAIGGKLPISRRKDTFTLPSSVRTVPGRSWLPTTDVGEA